MRYNYEQLNDALEKFGTKTRAAYALDMPRRTFGFLLNKAKKLGVVDYSPRNEVDEEIIRENVKYKRQTQKYQDTNRIERKSFREYAREYNCIEDLSREIIKKISLIEKPKNIKKKTM
ncbi:MAG: hypothetical protein NC124_02200 [Clostridium sp.]|nr:hypothetical protein [Clostridium sp.]